VALCTDIRISGRRLNMSAMVTNKTSGGNIPVGGIKRTYIAGTAMTVITLVDMVSRKSKHRVFK
jgi:hypothetical protein